MKTVHSAMESTNSPRIICQDTIYRPGQVLNGHVEIQASEKELYQLNVEIALVGVALTSLKTKNSIGTEYDGTSRLLCAHTHLKRTDDGRFPFSFTFPTQVQDLPHDRVMFSKWAYQQPFNTFNSKHVLPPSVEVMRSRYNAHVTAVVRYELVAKIASPYQGNSTLKRPVRFSLKSIPPAQVSRQLASKTSRFVVKGWELIPESQRPKGLSKLTAAVPRLDIDTFVFFPIHIYLEQAIETHIKITLITTDENVNKDPPEVVLHSFGVSLQAETTARSNKRFGEHKREMLSIPVFEHSLRREHTDAASRPDPEPFSGTNEFTKKIFVPPIPEAEVAPSFCTYNIVRSYRAKIRVGISCGKEVFFHDQEVRAIVYPSLADSESNTEESGLDPDPAIGEQLPSYEFAVTQASTSDDSNVYSGAGFNELRPVAVAPNVISTNEQHLPQEAMESFFIAAGVGGIESIGPYIEPVPRRYNYGSSNEPPIRVPGGVDGRGHLGTRPSRDEAEDKDGGTRIKT